MGLRCATPIGAAADKLSTGKLPPGRRSGRRTAGGARRIAAVAFATAAAFVSPAAQADRSAPNKWGAHLDFEGRWGEGRTLGDVGLFAPLWQSSVSLLFADVRGKLDNRDSAEGNFGLGLRHMLPSGWNLGAYGYIDHRRSGTGKHFQQATLGVEALSSSFDLRANAYLPFGNRTKSLGVTGGGVPFADFSGGTIEVVTPGTNRLLERALTGFDAEAGWRLPLLPLESLAQIRAYAGGYWFDGGGLVADIYGPRGRLELSLDDMTGRLPGARFTLGTEVQHDRLRSTQAYAMARLRLPLAAPEQARPRLTAQERRMTERVVRDVDVVTGSGTVAVPTLREAAVNTYNEQVVTSAAQVTPADQAELQAAIDGGGAGRVVILNGALAGVSGTTVIGANKTLLGGGTALPLRGASSGALATFTAPGAAGGIAGAVGGASGIVSLNAGSVAGGLTIENTSGFAMRAVSAAGAAAFGNTVTTTGVSGTAILFLNSSNGTATGNTITTTGGSSRAIDFLNSSNGTATGNTITTAGANSTAIRFVSYSNGSATGNTVTTTGANSVGVQVEQSTGITVAGNAFGAVGGAVIRTDSIDGTEAAAFAAGSDGNTWTGAGGGVLCSILTPTTGSVQFTDIGGGVPGSCPP